MGTSQAFRQVLERRWRGTPVGVAGASCRSGAGWCFFRVGCPSRIDGVHRLYSSEGSTYRNASPVGKTVRRPAMTAAFAPGDLVQARGREWVSLPSAYPGLLCLRPLTGSESDIQLLDPALESEPVVPARFDLPKLEDLATQDAGRL